MCSIGGENAPALVLDAMIAVVRNYISGKSPDNSLYGECRQLSLRLYLARTWELKMSIRGLAE